jgi:hypothetical protein
MEAVDPKDPSTERTNGGEVRLKARSMSQRRSDRRVVCLHGSNRQFFKIEIPESEVEARNAARSCRLPARLESS